VKEFAFGFDALALTGGRVVLVAGGRIFAPGHDVPHPIGDPDEDGGLPGDDDEEDDDDGEDEDDDEDDDEEPMQL
jgi:hypothetical protein